MSFGVPGKRVLLVVGGVLASLVLLEAGLQVAAWVRWSRDAGVARVPGERVVLCVGDSHTYGLEATDGASYPAQLEPILDGSDTGPWRVVNGGWPGRDSWDVLRHLPRQLEECRPEFVYVGVGANDFWRRPRLHSLAEAKEERSSGSFPLHWRTGLLISLLRGRVGPSEGTAGAAIPGDSPVLLGDWHVGRVPLRFERGGRLLIWPREFRWSLDGDRLTVADAAGWRMDARWREAPGGIELLGGSEEPPILLEQGPLPGFRGGPLGAHTHFRFNEGMAALHARDLPHAIDTFEAIVRHDPEFVQARGALAYALAKAGRAEEGVEQRAALAERYGRGRDPRVFEASMAAMAALPGEEGARRALAVDFASRTDDGLASFAVLAAQGLLADDPASARDVVETVLALLPPEARERRANLLRSRAHLLATADPAAALRDVIEAYRLDGKGSVAAQVILAHPESFTAEVLERTLRSPGLDAGLVADLEDVFREGRGEEGPAMAVLAGHLRAIVALCRERGARPALVSYCRPHPQIERVQERISRETGAPWVHIRREFDARVASGKGEGLIARGGHPTNAGYGVVARLVADDLLHSLPGR